MTQVLIDRTTLEQLVGALENHAGNYKLNKAESAVHRAAITAGLAALAKAEPTDSYDLAKRADNGGQP